MNRHLSRTLVVQIVYEWDFIGKKNLKPIIDRSVEIYKKDLDIGYVKKTIKGISKNIEAIDRQIIQVAPEWPIEQIANIDKAVLRVAIFEFDNYLEIPPKVIINEAVEIAKAFGGENSYKFVNGVLGTIYRKSARFTEEKIKGATDD